MPKQIEQTGLKPEEISITESGILEIIRYYTREAGVRNFEREIAKICRKVVKELYFQNQNGKVKKLSLRVSILEKYLGVKNSVMV